MSVFATITYKCGGCDATHATEQVPMKANRDPAHYESWTAAREAGTKLVVAVTEFPKLDARDYTPDGWVAFDPYTLCTYCHECWASIQGSVGVGE